MDDENDPPRPKTHEIGMRLDALSVEELRERITLLQEEIGRLEAAINAKQKTRSEAESIFRF